MTGKDLLYGVGAIAAGFAAYKIFKTVSKVSDAGGKLVDGLTVGVKELITKDLNPASPENVIYRGVNVLTGGDNKTNSLGTRIYDFFNPEKAAVIPVKDNAQTQFRRRELMLQAENDAIIAVEENKMSDRRNAFRLSELRQEPIRQYTTDYESFVAPILSQNTGA